MVSGDWLRILETQAEEVMYDILKKIEDDLKRLNDPEMRAKSDAARKQNLPRLKRMLGAM